jgi:hypothetical protein
MSIMRFTILVIPYLIGRGERVQLAGSDKGRFRVLMDRLREQMQFAESLGYDGFCMTEQHMQVEGIESTTNPLMWDYFVAQHTNVQQQHGDGAFLGARGREDGVVRIQREREVHADRTRGVRQGG